MNSKFKIIIDTGTWLKLDKLIDEKNINDKFLDTLYSLAEIYITPEIERELIYFSPHSWKKSKTYIIPVINTKDFQRAIQDGFDEADSSIFGINEISNYYVISEDRPLLEYGKIYKIQILFFAEFLVELLNFDLVSKKELYRLNRQLYNLRNINKNLFVKIKDFIQRFS
jgi:hypothetical protein